ncbi:MFS transporter [Luedemannella flava]
MPRPPPTRSCPCRSSRRSRPTSRRLWRRRCGRRWAEASAMYVSVRDRPGTDTTPAGRRGRVASTVVLLGVVSLLTDVSSEMVNAVLPIYLTKVLGLGILAYGVVDGIYQGVSALVRVVGGYLADRYDHPKWVAAAGYSVSALSRIALLPAHGFASVSAVITADRLGKGCAPPRGTR